MQNGVLILLMSNMTYVAREAPSRHLVASTTTAIKMGHTDASVATTNSFNPAPNLIPELAGQAFSNQRQIQKSLQQSICHLECDGPKCSAVVATHILVMFLMMDLGRPDSATASIRWRSSSTQTFSHKITICEPGITEQ